MYNKNKPLNSLSRRVILEDPNNEKKDLLFFSLSQCVIDLKKKGHKADIRMLQKGIKLNIPYFGYFCKYLYKIFLWGSYKISNYILENEIYIFRSVENQ
jgi:hypothetical protein